LEMVETLKAVNLRERGGGSSIGVWLLFHDM